MSFRKRNIPVNRTIPLATTSPNDPSLPTPSSTSTHPKDPPNPAIRPSPITSHLTTSTGTLTLDKLLGLGAGLALGTSLLIEEDGSTDFAGALVRAFAAEGFCQRQQVIVVAPKGWSNGLPGVADDKEARRRSSKGVGEEMRDGRDGGDGERMKIAWRYEKLGNLSAVEIERRGLATSSSSNSSSPIQDRPFCHTFDLNKRLDPPPHSLPVIHVQPASSPSGTSPYTPILQTLQQQLLTTTTTNNSTTFPLIRLIIPQILNPLFYPPSASDPNHLISFLHTLRSLTRTHPATLTILISWPLSLYPRTNILTRYAETILDGLLTLHPFPHSFSVDNAIEQGNDSKGDTETTQGLIRVWKLPVLSERGVSVGSGEDMAFAVSRRRFVVRPFHLGPLLEAEKRDDGSGSAGGGEAGQSKDGKVKIDAKKLEF